MVAVAARTTAPVHHHIRFTPSGSRQGFRALGGVAGASSFQANRVSITGFPY